MTSFDTCLDGVEPAVVAARPSPETLNLTRPATPTAPLLTAPLLTAPVLTPPLLTPPLLMALTSGEASLGTGAGGTMGVASRRHEKRRSA